MGELGGKECAETPSAREEGGWGSRILQENSEKKWDQIFKQALTHIMSKNRTGKNAQFTSKTMPSTIDSIRTVRPREYASINRTSCGAMKFPVTPVIIRKFSDFFDVSRRIGK